MYETEWGTVWATVGTFGSIVGALGGEPPTVITALDPDRQRADLAAELKALVQTVGANGNPGGPTS